MSTLLILAIAVLLLNYWLVLPVRESQDRWPDVTVFFSMSTMLVTVPLTWTISHLIVDARLVALRGLASVLLLSVVVQIGLRVLLACIELPDNAMRVLRRRTLLNASVLSLAVLHSGLNLDFGTALLLGIAAGVGFEFALYVFAEQQARIARSPVPRPFRGAPIALISAGLMALALMGLKGLF